MMSQRKLRRAKLTTIIIMCLSGIGVGLSIACAPSGVTVAVIGVLGETEVRLPLTYVLSGGLGLLGVALKYLYDRFDRLESTVVEHGSKLASGNEQLKLLQEVRETVHQIAQNCPRIGSKTDIHPPTPPPC
jgi:hypothetical protein